MLLRLYRSFLHLFPARYRSTFGPEMTSVFQQRQAEVWKQGLFYCFTFLVREFMSLISTAIREWARQSDAPEPQLAAGAAPGIFDSVPAFYTCEPYFPRRSALLHGGILSLAVFGVASAAFEYGVSHRLFDTSLSSFQPANQVQFIETGESGFVAFGRSLATSADGVLTLILGEQPATASIDLKPVLAKPGGLWSNLLWLLRVRPHLRSGEFRVQGFTHTLPEEPQRDYASVYFQVMPVLRILDADGDHIISAAEIANAPAALSSLDRNHDGKLSPEECGQTFGDSPVYAQVQERARLEFMRFHPVLAALDANHDGEISASEIQNAAASLKTLDKNGDGKLTQDEALPDPVANAVFFVMRLDANRDGRISKDERSGELARRYRELLDTADQNKDGVVTKDELTNEIRRRTVTAVLTTEQK
jgi:Ca2+-binding EF-hand superfamily protein